jgi:hypothetical protein
MKSRTNYFILVKPCRCFFFYCILVKIDIHFWCFQWNIKWYTNCFKFETQLILKFCKIFLILLFLSIYRKWIIKTIKINICQDILIHLLQTYGVQEYWIHTDSLFDFICCVASVVFDEPVTSALPRSLGSTSSGELSMKSLRFFCCEPSDHSLTVLI